MTAIARLSRFAIPVVTVVVLTASAPSVFATDWRQSGSQRCAVTGCGSSGSGSSSSGGQTYSPPPVYQPSAADLKQRQVLALQQQGLAQFRAGKLVEALRLYELSLKLCVAPEDIQALKGNIGETHANLGVQAYKRGNVEQALRHFELAKQYLPDLPHFKGHIADNVDNLTTARNEVAAKQQAKIAEQQDKAAAKNMQQSIQNFAQTLNATPASGGLDFDGHNSGGPAGSAGNGGGLDFASVVTATNQTASASARPSGDPRVVDARNVPSRLSKPVENAIAGAYANAPPGVSDRVRKGFQAVADNNWKVAKALFEEALQRDPGNARLKGLVTALAGQSPDRKPANGAARDPAPARYTLASLNANASKMSTAQVLKALEDITTEHFFEQALGGDK